MKQNKTEISESMLSKRKTLSGKISYQIRFSSMGQKRLLTSVSCNLVLLRCKLDKRHRTEMKNVIKQILLTISVLNWILMEHQKDQDGLKRVMNLEFRRILVVLLSQLKFNFVSPDTIDK